MFSYNCLHDVKCTVIGDTQPEDFMTESVTNRWLELRVVSSDVDLSDLLWHFPQTIGNADWNFPPTGSMQMENHL